jgi:hypothetical protein
MKTIKEELTTRDIIKIVCDGLGSGDPIDNRNGILQFQTICHNPPGQGKYKLYYYISTKMFHCYTECNDSFDILELVMRVKKCSLPEATKFIIQITGKYPGREGYDFQERASENCWDCFENGDAPVEEKNLPISTHYLQLFDNKVPFIWNKEGISVHSMKKFNIMLDYASEKIIIPHWDSEGNLIGIRGRSLNVCEVLSGNKYMPVKCGSTYLAHALGQNLYGINFNKDIISKKKRAILFEGEKSVLKYEDLDPNNNIALAVCGSNISNEQIEILKTFGVEEVVIAFDKMFTDNKTREAREYRERIVKLGLKFPISMSVYYLWDDNGLIDYKNSPIDHGPKVFKILCRMKKLIKQGIKNGEERRTNI